MSIDKRQKLKQAILTKRVTDKESLKQFILEEKKKDELIAEVLEVIPKTQKGEDGHTPTDKELLTLIKPLIEKIKPNDGKPGADGKTPTDAQIKRLVASVMPDEDTIADKVAEKVVIPTLNEVEKNIPMLGEEIRDSLELLLGDDRLDKSAIRGLKEIEELAKKKGDTNYYGGSGIKEVVAGTGISVDNTNLGYPVISAPGSTTDEKVKLSALDPTAGYLNDKLSAGAGISYTNGVIENTDKGSDVDLSGLLPDSHLTDFTHADIAHANRSALDDVAGENTGDQVGDGVTITGAGTLADPFVSAGGGGGTPGGDDGDLQYNNAGAFGGFGKYDATNKRIGVNQETPLGTGHFGADTYTVGDASDLTATYTQLFSGGLNFGVAWTYNLYGKRTEKTIPFYSVNPATLTTPNYSITPVVNGSADYTAVGYAGDSTTWYFTVYPLYDSNTNLGTGYDYPVQGDGTGYGYRIHHAITAPNWGTPSGYIFVRNNDDAYWIQNSLIFDDENNSWYGGAIVQLATYAQITGLQIDLSWTGATDADDYRILNVTNAQWTDKGDTTEAITDDDTWTAGTPAVIPKYYTDTALIADGQAILKEELTHQGTLAGFFNTAPIYKPTGDVATALGALGLVGTPTYDPTNIAGTAYRIPFFDSTGVMTTDADLIYRDDAAGFGFDRAGINPSNIQPNSFNIASQMNFIQHASINSSGDKHNVYTTNRSHIDSNASGSVNITGFEGGYDGKILFVTNREMGTLQFTQNSSSSSAGNRILLGDYSSTFTITGLGPRTYMFIYDAKHTLNGVTGFWKLVGGDRETILGSTNYWNGVQSFRNCTFNSGIVTSIKDKTTAYTTTIDDFIIGVTSGTFAITLMASNNGTVHYITNKGTGVITLNTTSSQTIDGIASGVLKLNPNDSIMVYAKGTGAGWKILNLHRHASTQGLESGTYTPTLYNTTNVAASTARLATYYRVGNTVTVSGQLDIDPTSTLTATLLGISLPIASAFTTAYQLGGTACATAIAGMSAGIEADATNDRASLKYIAVDVTNQTMAYQFTYTIL